MFSTRTTTSAPSGQGLRAKKALHGALIGSVIDNFDIYLPLVALAPAITYFIPATLSAQTAALIASWIFVATMVARPLGALIFGSLADAIGRRRSTLIAVGAFGVATLLMAALPGYEQIGMFAVVALILLRFLGGIALGGEYSGANVLAMEESPKRGRGLSGGIIQTGGTVAYVLLTAITLLLLAVMPHDGPDSAFLLWGWRIPFVLGAALAFAFLVYYSREVSESTLWKKTAVRKNSAISLFTGKELRGLIQVFILMTGMWLLLNSVTALIPTVLKTRLQLSPSDSTLVVMAVFIALTVIYIVGGALSQVVGRRAYMVGAALVCLLVGIPSYGVLIVLGRPSVWVAMIPAVLAGIFVLAPCAVITSYLSERFRTGNRGVGYGLGYTLAIILPSFYASYQIWLSAVLPAQYTVLVLIAIGGTLVIVGALAGPETKDIDFHRASDERDGEQALDDGDAARVTVA